jgi:hypothetical protein
MRPPRRWRTPIAPFFTIALFYWKLFFPKQFTFLASAEQTNQAFSCLNSGSVLCIPPLFLWGIPMRTPGICFG